MACKPKNFSRREATQAFASISAPRAVMSRPPYAVPPVLRRIEPGGGPQQGVTTGALKSAPDVLEWLR
jgi:hypothetical protein